ncbi:MAG: metalloregulator ArsR/SmtB family transcription factor [Betaproteobacteria bacterium]|nr:metalloregulator ArsR/SmtB family transcription factor [Betaproteobacteria bacterium]
MSTPNIKHQLFEQFARVGKALGSPVRLDLLECLGQGQRSVEALAEKCGLPVSNASHHLQQLRHAGLVSAEKEGLYVRYRLAGDEVVGLLNALRSVAEQNIAEVEQLVRTYLTVKDTLEPVPAGELLDRVRKGLVTVLDVRPPDEYAAGHIAGAVNVPLAELEKYLHKLKPKKEVVAYCRGPHCVLSYDAVAKLRARGIKARRLEEGYPEWKAAGLPVEA